MSQSLLTLATTCKEKDDYVPRAHDSFWKCVRIVAMEINETIDGPNWTGRKEVRAAPAILAPVILFRALPLDVGDMGGAINMEITKRTQSKNAKVLQRQAIHAGGGFGDDKTNPNSNQGRGHPGFGQVPITPSFTQFYTNNTFDTFDRNNT